MEVVKKFFPKILSENDANYFAHLEGVISSIDELANVQITKNPHSYQFRIAPSVPRYLDVSLFQSPSRNPVLESPSPRL